MTLHCLCCAFFSIFLAIFFGASYSQRHCARHVAASVSGCYRCPFYFSLLPLPSQPYFCLFPLPLFRTLIPRPTSAHGFCVFFSRSSLLPLNQTHTESFIAKERKSRKNKMKTVKIEEGKMLCWEENGGKIVTVGENCENTTPTHRVRDTVFISAFTYVFLFLFFFLLIFSSLDSFHATFVCFLNFKVLSLKIFHFFCSFSFFKPKKQ